MTTKTVAPVYTSRAEQPRPSIGPSQHGNRCGRSTAGQASSGSPSGKHIWRATRRRGRHRPCGNQHRWGSCHRRPVCYGTCCPSFMLPEKPETTTGFASPGHRFTIHSREYYTVRCIRRIGPRFRLVNDLGSLARCRSAGDKFSSNPLRTVRATRRTNIAGEGRSAGAG